MTKTKKKALIKGKMYLFEWNDTYSIGGWFSNQDIEASTRDCTQFSIGFFIHETKDWFVIGAHMSAYEDTNQKWGNIDWIPRSTVRKVKQL